MPLLGTRGVTPSTQSKFSLWGRGLGVMYMGRAPNLSIPCVQLHGQHHCIPFDPHMQKKPGGISTCRFWAPAE